MKEEKGENSPFVKFIGTAGARFVVMKQLRSSGGVWLSSGRTHLYIDPGPGALVRCLSSRPRMDPSALDGIVLTHKHLDHSNDVNVMIEAMTEGGFRKKGVLFAPEDALEKDPVVFNYVRGYLENIEILGKNSQYRIGDMSFSTALRHKHGVETYGINFTLASHTISFISDTRFFSELPDLYQGEVLVINVVRREPVGDDPIDHLSVEDVKTIVRTAKPKLTVLTHFGMTLTRAKPWEVAAELEKELGVKVIAASDGMKLNLNEV
jgi:phosphoribosyl 1,2-cyclic phosphodiesterase